MGRGVLTYEQFRNEQVQLAQRTSDPADPEPEEMWLRVDIKPTYEDADGNSQTGVAEIRVANADGTIDAAPVASLGDSTSADVIDKVRPYVTAGGSPTGTGFIPFAASGATYPNRKLEHPTDGRVAMHDALTASVIPDSVVSQYDATQEGSTGGITSIADQVASFDLSGNATVVSDGINSQQSYRFDASDDVMVNSSVSLSTDPWAVLIVCKLNNTDTNDFIFNEDSSDLVGLQDNDGGDYNLYRGGGNPLAVGSTDTNSHLMISEFINDDGAALEVDGSDLGSNTQNAVDASGFRLNQRTGDGYVGMDVGECVLMEDYTTDDLDSERSRLADKWGIALA